MKTFKVDMITLGGTGMALSIPIFCIKHKNLITCIKHFPPPELGANTAHFLYLLIPLKRAIRTNEEGH
jgi:hypothetical protein